MSDATLRAEIKTRLLAHGAAIGRVHDYERWSSNSKQFLSLFQDPSTKKIFGWEIMRVRIRFEKIGMVKWKMIHRYMIRGYYGLEDGAETEKAVNALVDQIVLDFARVKIAGTQGSQLPEADIGPRMFGHILCHVVEILLPEVAEIVTLPAEVDETDLEIIGLEYYLKPGDDELDASDIVTLEQA